jgi:hypothetical protein
MPREKYSKKNLLMLKPEAISMRGVRRATLEQLMQEHDGNVQTIAEFLHQGEDFIRYLLKQYELLPEEDSILSRLPDVIGAPSRRAGHGGR